MGKGDKKSKRGKIIMGSYGVSRPKRKIVGKLVSSQAESKPEKPEVKQKVTVAEAKTKTKVAEPKPKVAKKPKSEEKPENLKVVDEAENKETEDKI
jgi:ribosomal small subunit protein bTHX